MRELPLVLASRHAADLGVRPDSLRPGYSHQTRGVYLADWLDPSDADVRLAVAAEVAAPGVTIGGWAAARVHEARNRPRDDQLSVFDGRRAYDEPRGVTPLLVMAPPEARIATRPGWQVFRSRVPDAEREMVGDAWITTPLRTAFDLARRSSRAGSVIALDRLLSLGLVDREELLTLIDERRRWRGVNLARWAAHVADGAVRSPRESMMRLEWMAAGLPRPVCNAVVEDSRGGFVAMVDLLDEATGLVGEYDGEDHAGAERRRTDSSRRERVLEAGLTPVTMTAADAWSDARRAEWRERLRRQWRVAARRPRAWRVGSQAAI